MPMGMAADAATLTDSKVRLLAEHVQAHMFLMYIARLRLLLPTVIHIAHNSTSRQSLTMLSEFLVVRPVGASYPAHIPMHAHTVPSVLSSKVVP